MVQDLNVADELFPLHRLDSGTEGVCVLGKTKAFAQRFGQLMQSSSAAYGNKNFLQKTYLALAPTAAPVGVLRHWVVTNSRAPGLPPFTLVLPSQPSPDCGEPGVECVLEICEVQLPSGSLCARA